MLWKVLIFAHLLILSACTSPQPLAVETAQAALVEAWSADQHLIGEIDWPQMPSGSLLTVETWRAGSRYRYEILESTAPALVGEILIFDGQIAWRYNRFDTSPMSPRRRGEELSEPALSPVSDVFAVISRLITTPAQIASQEKVRLNHHLAQKITLTFANGDQLAFWRNETTRLPIQVTFITGAQQVTLKARRVERLINPPEELFKP